MQRNILWKPTLQVNAVRLICCAIVWFIIIALTGIGGNDNPFLAFGFPLIYIPIAGIAMLFRGSAIGGFFNLAALITILPADPLVFLLRILVPSLVPMNYYSPVMLAFFLYVHD